MSWKDIKIAKKLYIGFGIVLGLTAALGYVAVSGLKSISTDMTMQQNASKTILWTMDCAVARRDFVNSSDPKQVETINNKLEDIAKVIAETQLIANTEEQAMLKEIDETSGQYQKLFAQFADMQLKLVEIDAKCVELGRAAQTAGSTVGGTDGLTIDNLVRQCRQHEKNYQMRKDMKWAEEVYTAADKALAYCDRIGGRGRSAGKAGEAKTAITAYLNGFKEYVSVKESQKELGKEVGAAASAFLQREMNSLICRRKF